MNPETKERKSESKYILFALLGVLLIAAAGVYNLSQLTDVDTNGALINQSLVYNGSYWIPMFTNGSTGGESLWQQSGSDIYYNSGNVGIGTDTPSYPLHVTKNNTGSNVSVFATGEMHASAFVVHSRIYDREKSGRGIDHIKNPDAYRNADGSINYRAYGPSRTVTSIPITERIVSIVNVTEEICYEGLTRETSYCENVTSPHEQIEEREIGSIEKEGIDLQAETNLLRDALYDIIKETCERDTTYSWC